MRGTTLWGLCCMPSSRVAKGTTLLRCGGVVYSVVCPAVELWGVWCMPSNRVAKGTTLWGCGGVVYSWLTVKL